MTVIRAVEAQRFDLPGVVFTALAAPSRGSAEICTWRITVAAGVESGAHTLDRDEIFMVTSGTLRVTPDGDLVGPGDAVVVPAGSPIALANPGEAAAEAYIAIRAGFTAVLADGSSMGTPPWAQ